MKQSAAVAAEAAAKLEAAQRLQAWPHVELALLHPDSLLLFPLLSLTVLNWATIVAAGVVRVSIKIFMNNAPHSQEYHRLVLQAGPDVSLAKALIYCFTPPPPPAPSFFELSRPKL
eukprot:4191294-Pleurochrysis_carterae.AAC.1